MPHGGNYFNDDCEVRKSPFVKLELCKFREKVQKLLKNIALFTSVTYTLGHDPLSEPKAVFRWQKYDTIFSPAKKWCL